MPDSRNSSAATEVSIQPKSWLSPAGIWLSDRDRNQLEMSISSDKKNAARMGGVFLCGGGGLGLFRGELGGAHLGDGRHAALLSLNDLGVHEQVPDGVGNLGSLGDPVLDAFKIGRAH